MNNQWFYTHNGSEYGPVSIDELHRLVASGSLKSSDYVRKNGTIEQLEAGKVSEVFGPTPPPIPPLKSTPTDPLQDLFGKAKKLWSQVSESPAMPVLNSVRAQFTDAGRHGEPYNSATDARELFRGTVYCTLPRDLCKTGTKIRVILEGENIVLVKRGTFKGPESILARYSLSQLSAIEKSPTLKGVSVGGFLYSTAQVFRNTDKYGYWDGQAATNLQNAGESPGLVDMSGMMLTFSLPEVDIGEHAFVIAESNETKQGSMTEAQLYVKRLITKQSDQARSSLLSQLKDVRSAIEEDQSEVTRKLAAVKKDREKNQAEIQELRDQIAARKSASAEPTKPSASARKPETTSELSGIELIKQLASLRDAGVLSEAEFESKKKEILERL